MAEKKKKRASAYDNFVEDIKVEHDIPVSERIRYPIVWERTASGYRIQDLQLSKLDNAVELIKDYFIKEETLCRGIGLVDDDDAVEEYLLHVGHWLRDTQSLVAVQEGSGTIVGLLVGRVLDRTTRTQSRMMVLDEIAPTVEVPETVCEPSCQQVERPVDKSRLGHGKNQKKEGKTTAESVKNAKPAKKNTNQTPVKLTSITAGTVKPKIFTPMFDDEDTIVYNPKLQELHKFKSYLTRKVDVLSLYDVGSYYSIYILFVQPDHRNRGVGKALMRSIMELSKRFGCDILSGTFTSRISQNIAHKEGFKVQEEIHLKTWSEDLVEPIFTFDEDDTAAVMCYKTEIPPPPPPTPPAIPPRRKNPKN